MSGLTCDCRVGERCPECCGLPRTARSEKEDWVDALFTSGLTADHQQRLPAP